MQSARKQRNSILAAAQDAADEILSSVYRIDVGKALNPLKAKDFVTISRRLTNALKGVARNEEARVLRAAINRLDVDWPNLSDAQRDRVVDAARAALTPRPALFQQVQEVFEVQGKTIAGATREGAKRSFGLNIQTSLTEVDQRVIQQSATAQANFVRDEFGRRSDVFSQKARDIVSSSLERGMGREEVMERLSAGLGEAGLVRSDNYWRTVGNSFAGRSRSYANLSSMRDGGVKHFTFEAVLDELTSEVCRFMHGKKFKVESGLGAFQRTAELSDPGNVKDTQPWLAMGSDGEGNQFLYFKNSAGEQTRVADVVETAEGQLDTVGQYADAMSISQLEAAGIVTPPLHGNCRSTIVAED